MAQAKRTVVGSPLAPSSLSELKAFEAFPPTPADFRPEESWTSTYQIWTCHGYREVSNDDVGWLRLERRASGNDHTFTLKAHQVLANDEGRANVVRAEIQCRIDAIASPVRWHLSSDFEAPDGADASALTVEEDVRVAGANLAVKQGERSFTRKALERLTGNWCVFEFVQRLPFAAEAPVAFDMLEEMSVLKERQRLSYRGTNPVQIDGKELVLHVFQQVGHGVLPYEYYLDDRHRLLAAVTGSRAYFLDDRAEESVTARLSKSRRWYKGKLEQLKEGE